MGDASRTKPLASVPLPRPQINVKELGHDAMIDTLGLYLSIPFCRGKCTFCNFASDAFDPGLLPGYVETLCGEILGASARADRLHACLPPRVDSIYLGGGTPSLLAPAQVKRIFVALRSTFHLAPDAEITVECAPGQLSTETLAALRHEGMNRISFGVQSFIDQESAGVGRRHTGAQCRQEIERVLLAGIQSVGVDLIAGLPYQTRASWHDSLSQLLASGADHASVYLLEVDEDSRLGREVLDHGSRFGAATVPDDDLTADLYEDAIAVLSGGGLAQYEISNFARPGRQSRHNLKYWERQPYLGFGLDAHSMLRSTRGAAIRFANGEELHDYIGAPAPANIGTATTSLRLLPRAQAAGESPHTLSTQEAVEETLFLGLRRNAGIDLANLSDPQADTAPFRRALTDLAPVLDDACTHGLLAREGTQIRLTDRGRLLSNELFSQLLLTASST